MRPLFHVVAQGHFVTQLGRRCFPLNFALDMVRDLRSRGYGDAHVQGWNEDRPYPPFVVRPRARKRPAR